MAKRRAGASHAEPVAMQEVLETAKEATQAILAGDAKLQKDRQQEFRRCCFVVCNGHARMCNRRSTASSRASRT